MRFCGIFGVLLLHLLAVYADVSHLQIQNNYHVPVPDLDLRPPEPQDAQFFKAQPDFESNQMQLADMTRQIQQYQFRPALQYLPPYQQYSQRQQPKNAQHANRYVGPEYLPPSDHRFSYQAPTYLPPAPEPRQQAVSQLSLELPAGYDFVKPAGAEAAIAELHTLPADDQPRYTANQGGKIRTVQIVNESAVKTWKILETEEAGVKIIKLLGPSNENPSGDHRVVKVQVPGAHTQIVKVYNDHKNVENLNQYLPPAQSSRTSHKRSIRVSNEGFYTKL